MEDGWWATQVEYITKVQKESVSHHCDKTPELTSVKGGRLLLSEIPAHGPFGSIVLRGDITVECWRSTAAHGLSARKHRERIRVWGSNSPTDAYPYITCCPLAKHHPSLSILISWWPKLSTWLWGNIPSHKRMIPRSSRLSFHANLLLSTQPPQIS